MPSKTDIKSDGKAAVRDQKTAAPPSIIPHFFAFNREAFSIPLKKLHEDENKKLEKLYQYAPIANAEKQAEKKDEKDEKIVNSKATTFNQQLEKLFQALTQWGKDQRCESLEKSISELKDRFKEYSKSPQQLSSAKYFLEQIYLYLINGDIELAKRKDFYERLRNEIIYCGPGTYVKLENLSELISSNDTLERWIYLLRKKIIEDIVALYIFLHPAPENFEQSSHVSIAFSRYAHQYQWGIEAPHDQYEHLNQHSALDYDKLHQAFSEQFTPQKLVDELTTRITKKIKSLLELFGLENKLLWGKANANAKADFDQFTEILTDFFYEKLGFKIPIPKTDRYESPLTHFFDQKELEDPGRLKFKPEQVKPALLRTLYHLSQQGTGPFRKEVWQVIELKDGKKLYFFYNKPAESDAGLFWLEQPEHTPQTWEQYSAGNYVNPFKALLQAAADETQIKQIIKAFVCCTQGKLIAQLAPVLLEYICKNLLVSFIPLHGLNRFVFLLTQQKCWKEAEQALQLDIAFDLNVHCCPDTGYFTLHYAVAAKQIVLIKLLCAKGANPLFVTKKNNVPGQFAETTLDLVFKNPDTVTHAINNSQISATLTNCIKKLNPQQRGVALAQAADQEEWQRIKKDCDAKQQIDLNEFSPVGRKTVLQSIIASDDFKDEKLITQLIAKGADCTLKGGFVYHSALQFAQTNKNSDALSKLILNSPIEILQQCDRDILGEILITLVPSLKLSAILHILENINPPPLLNKTSKTGLHFYQGLPLLPDSQDKLKIILKTVQILKENPAIYQQEDYHKMIFALALADDDKYWLGVIALLQVPGEIKYLNEWAIVTTGDYISHIAAKKQRFHILKLLLLKGISLNIPQRKPPHKTAFELGCEVNPGEMRDFVIGNPAFIKQLSMTNLKFLLQDLITNKSWPEITEYIQQINQASNAAEKSLPGKSYVLELVALIFAQNEYWDGLQETFKSITIRFNYALVQSGNSVSHLAAQKKRFDVLRFLVNKGVNLHIPQSKPPGKTAFQLACEADRHQMRMLVIEKPILIHQLDVSNLELLLEDLIAGKRWPEIMDFFQQVNKPTAADEKSSPNHSHLLNFATLLFAKNAYWDGVLEIFKKYGILAIHLCDPKTGDYPSHLAAKQQRFDILKLLVAKGLSLHIPQEKPPGKTAFQLGFEANPDKMRDLIAEDLTFIKQIDTSGVKSLLQDLITNKRWTEIARYIQQINKTLNSIADQKSLPNNSYFLEITALMFADNDYWDGLRETFSSINIAFNYYLQGCGNSVAHFAAKKQRFDVLKMLVNKGVNLHVPQQKPPKETVFQIGCDVNSQEMRALLIEKPLFVQELNIQLLELLLQDLMANKKWSELIKFIQQILKPLDEKTPSNTNSSKFVELIALLLAKKEHWDGLLALLNSPIVAKFDDSCLENGDYLTHISAKKKRFDVLKLLIAKGANLLKLQPHYPHKTVLQLGCLENPREMRVLLAEKPLFLQQLNVQHIEEITCLFHDLSSNKHWAEIVDYIQQINSTSLDEKSTPNAPRMASRFPALVVLMLAENANWDGVIAILKSNISAVFDFFHLEETGDSLSHLAVKKRYFDVLKLLLLKDLNLHKPQNEFPNKTVFQLGCATNPHEMRMLLIEKPLLIHQLNLQQLESLLQDLIANKRWAEIAAFIQQIDKPSDDEKTLAKSKSSDLIAVLLAINEQWDGLQAIFNDEVPIHFSRCLLDDGSSLSNVKKHRFDALKSLITKKYFLSKSHTISISLSDFSALARFQNYFDDGDILFKAKDEKINNPKHQLNNKIFNMILGYSIKDQDLAAELMVAVNEKTSIEKPNSIIRREDEYHGEFDYKSSKDINAFLTDVASDEKQSIKKDLADNKALYQIVIAKAQHHRQAAKNANDVDEQQLHRIHEQLWRKKQLQLLVHAQENGAPIANKLISEALQHISNEALPDSNVFYLRLSTGQLLSFVYPDINTEAVLKIDNEAWQLPDRYSDYKIIGVTEAEGEILLRIGVPISSNTYSHCLLILISKNDSSNYDFTILGTLLEVRSLTRDRIQNDLIHLGKKTIAIREFNTENVANQIYIFDWWSGSLKNTATALCKTSISRMACIAYPFETTNPKIADLLIITLSNFKFAIWNYGYENTIVNSYCGQPKSVLIDANSSALICEDPTFCYQLYDVNPISNSTTRIVVPITLQPNHNHHHRILADPEVEAITQRLDTTINIATKYRLNKVTYTPITNKILGEPVFADLTVDEKLTLQNVLKTKTPYQAVKDFADHFENESKKIDGQLEQKAIADEKGKSIVWKGYETLPKIQEGYYVQEALWRAKQIILSSLTQPQIDSKDTSLSQSAITMRLNWLLKRISVHRIQAGLSISGSTLISNNRHFNFANHIIISAMHLNNGEVMVRLACSSQSNQVIHKLVHLNLTDNTITYFAGYIPRFKLSNDADKNNMVYLGKQSFAVITSDRTYNNTQIETLTWSGNTTHRFKGLQAPHIIRKIWRYSQDGCFLLAQSAEASGSYTISLLNINASVLVKTLTIDADILAVLADGKIILSNFKVLDFSSDLTLANQPSKLTRDNTAPTIFSSPSTKSYTPAAADIKEVKSGVNVVKDVKDAKNTTSTNYVLNKVGREIPNTTAGSDTEPTPMQAAVLLKHNTNPTPMPAALSTPVPTTVRISEEKNVTTNNSGTVSKPIDKLVPIKAKISAREEYIRNRLSNPLNKLDEFTQIKFATEQKILAYLKEQLSNPNLNIAECIANVIAQFPALKTEDNAVDEEIQSPFPFVEKLFLNLLMLSEAERIKSFRNTP